MTPIIKVSAQILLFLSVCSHSLKSADYYISPTGVDITNSGSIAEPWASFSYAVSQLSSGDRLLLRGGSYGERLILNGLSGTEPNPIQILNYSGENPVIDGTGLTVPNSGRAGLVVIEDCDYIEVSGLKIQNYKTSTNGRIPVGIQIEGSGSGIVVADCEVTEIWQSSSNSAANGFGVSVYGTSNTPIDGLRLESNRIHNLRTGQSESVVLNGNVINFSVLNNEVYDCNNIGIDFIGYEGTAPTAYDRARDGICRGNLVYDVDSFDNPGYGGSVGSGGGDRSAAGIYVDGGTNIVIEGNEVYGCNFGIELASEDPAGFTDYISMRNNLLHHNLGPGIIMGGYDSARGQTRFCEVLNNTLYRNDTLLTYGGQIALQFYLSNNTFKNNIIWSNESSQQMIIHYVEGGSSAQRAFDTATNVFDYNVYYSSGSSTDIEFGLNATGSGSSSGNTSYYGLAAWRSVIGSDSNSSFQNPGFLVPAPSASPQAEDFQLSETSLSRDAGDPSFVAATGELDFFGASRVANGRVDIGFEEYMTALQAWRDQYFGLPDGTLSAANDQDPEGDGLPNLIEYSQGTDPTVSDADQGPYGEQNGNVFRFAYRKEAAELTYIVQSTPDFASWPGTLLVEQNDGSGLYWRDFPIDDKLFVRLSVSE